MKMTTRPIRIHNLGQIAGEIMKLRQAEMQEEMELAEDLAAFHAPSECNIAYMELAEYEPKVQAVFAKYGITEQLFNEELRHRCSGKFIYYHYL